jgi:23S rRNA pseudouridine1911/1915/1917 synthase
MQEEVGTRSFVQNLIEQQLVRFRGQPAKASHKVSPGESFEVFLPAPQPPGLEPYDFPLDIVFEDEDVIVVNKPAGLVVHPAHGHTSDTLINALIHHNKTLSQGFMKERPGLIHRLDKDTSGLIVVAKTDVAQNSLAQQFSKRTVARRYWALVLGQVKADSGTRDSHLARHPVDRKRFASLPNESEAEGKHAITHFKTLARSNGFSLLELKLETGRTHQIRVHLSEMGYPIVGDELYGGIKPARNLKSVAARNYIQSMSRFALHAFELGFFHFRRKEQMLFHSPWPEDLMPLVELANFDHLPDVFNHV